MQDNADATSKNILTGAAGVRELNDHVLILPAQGNALAVRLSDSIVLVDSGAGRGATARMCRTSTTLSARDNHLGRFSGR